MPTQARGPRLRLADCDVLHTDVDSGNLDGVLVPSRKEWDILCSVESFPKGGFKRAFYPRENAQTTTFMHQYAVRITQIANYKYDKYQLTILIYRRCTGITFVDSIVDAPTAQQLQRGIVATFVTGEEAAELCGIRAPQLKGLACPHVTRWAMYLSKQDAIDDMEAKQNKK